MVKLRKNKGITLIALVITIIVLLILAGITISQLAENGLFNNTQLAKEEYANATSREYDILKQYENAITTGEVTSDRETITISKEEWDKVEKAEIISTTKLCYGNTTLNYNFSKYKKIKCYAVVDAITLEFNIDLQKASGYSGGVTGPDENNTTYIYTCKAKVNNEKNILTLVSIGFIDGTTYNDRLISGRENQYYIYKIEGIY